MDTSTRQRGIRPNQPASFSGFPSKLRNEVSDDVRGRPSPRPLGSWRSTGPGAGSQVAPSSVVAGRRLFDRNQHRHASNSPANTPGKLFNRTGLANGSTPKFTFSPRLNPNATRESFTAVTPGRSFRGSTADLNGRAMSKTSSTNLFPMRIASPPPELDGEELAKQVPDSPGRVGSVYADEFLSHLVPAELDDLQRRQFLCVLDLRRLKYAASEIFAKKDWRVNIMNFAKEYEKSRSLIMLRYGLYEFKTVPASRELLKKWKEENNVPEDEEMEEAEAPKVNGTSNSFRSSVKRRAGDDEGPNKRRVTERDPLTESTALTSNAGATPFAKKTKRGAEHLDDENQPSKKKSSTLSIFEDVANSSPARQAASPTKPAAKNLFAQPPAQASREPNFGAGAKVPSSNIFGHLSEQNSPEGSDDDEDNDGGSEDAEAEDEEPASQTPAPKAAANSAPSLFGIKKPSDSTDGGSQGAGLFGRTTKGGDGEPVRAPADGATSLFGTKPPASPTKEAQDRTWNPNTPIKFGGAASQPGASLFGATTSQPSSIFANKPKDGTGSAFGSTTPKASAAPTFGTQVQDFAKETPKHAAPSLFGQPSKPSESSSGLFGNASSTPAFGASTPAQQKSAEPESSATPAIGLFGQPSAASTTPFGKPAETAATQAPPTSIFANLNTPATTTQASAPSLFGTTSDKPSGPLFGAKGDDKPSSTPSLFGAQPYSTSTLLGTKPSSVEEKKEVSAPKRKKPDSDEAGAVFGSTSAEPASKKYTFGGNAPTPASSLPPKTAEAANGSTEAGAVFGTGSQDTGKSYSFGSTASSTPAVSSKPADTPAPSSLFGNPAPQAEPAKTQPSIFANAPTPAPSTGFTFGGASSTPSSNLFGAGNDSKPSSNLFGATSGTDSNNVITNPQSSFTFGSTGTPAPAPAPAANSFTFNAGGGDQSSFKNPFSSGDAAGLSFDFGATPAQSQSASTPFQFGNITAPAAPASSSFTFGGDSQPATNGPSSSSFTFGGASQPANNAPAPSSNMFGGQQPNGGSSMFNFGGTPQALSQPTTSANMFSGQPANAAQGIFAGSLAPPAGSSTGTNTPLFGGASSLATTPAAGTPEPDAAQAKKDNATSEQTADEDGKPQEQISLTEGGPGEEDELVVHEVRAKALRLAPKSDDDDEKDKGAKKNPWKTEGLGPLRLLKHKSTGAVRLLLRGEPRGNVAMNKTILPDFDYKVDKGAKWIKVPCAKEDGKGLETWMLQVKTNELAVKLTDALEEHKKANK